MDDRKLLEMAAKAAERTIGFNSIGLPDARDNWNPLQDDGDALRLAVELGICIEYSHDNMTVVCFSVQVEDKFITQDCGNNSFAATRRAIVRAAAAMAEKGE